MEEFFDLIPGGRLTLGALALLAVPGVRRQLRPVAKAAVRVGLTVTDQMKEFVAEAREQTNDLMAEVRSERTQGSANGSEPATDARAGARRRASEGSASV